MAFQTYGSDVKKGNTNDYATATAWTSVGCVIAVTPPNPSVNNVEVPLCLNSASRVKQNIPGSVNPGEASYTILFAAGDIDTAVGLLGSEGAWKIVLGNSNKSWVFNGYFAGFSVPELTENGFIQLTANIVVSGTSDEVSGS